MFVAQSLLKKGLAARSYIFFSKYSFLNRLFFLRKISSFTNKLFGLCSADLSSTFNLLTLPTLVKTLDRFLRLRGDFLKKLFLVLSTHFANPLVYRKSTRLNSSQ